VCALYFFVDGCKKSFGHSFFTMDCCHLRSLAAAKKTQKRKLKARGIQSCARVKPSGISSLKRRKFPFNTNEGRKNVCDVHKKASSDIFPSKALYFLLPNAYCQIREDYDTFDEFTSLEKCSNCDCAKQENVY